MHERCCPKWAALPAGLALLVAAITVTGCAGPVDGEPTPRDSAELTVAGIVANIPELEAQLPASLRGEDQGGSRSIARAIGSRAIGDTTIVTADSLNDVKSQAWFDMRANVGLDATTKMFLDALRAYAAENEFDYDTVFSLGVRPLTDFDGDGTVDSIDLGKAIAQRGDDGRITVSWAFEMDTELFPGGTADMDPILVYLRLIVNVDQAGTTDALDDVYTVTMNCEIVYPPGTYDPAQATTTGSYSHYSEATGRSDVAVDTPYMDSVVSSRRNTDGSHTVISKNIGILTGYSIAWGDEARGGVASSYDTTYLNTEFYNGEGHLILQSYGELEAYTGWIPSQLINYPDVSGVTTGPAPQTLYVREKWTGDEWQYSVGETEDGAGYDVTSDWPTSRGLSFQATTGTWSPGDVYYYQTGCEYLSSSDEYLLTYTIGYQVPVPTTSFGQDWYTTREYPLKHVLPLASAYSSYDLVQKEGETTTDTFTNWDGEEESWSWTRYSYFLDLDGDGEMHVGDGDIAVDGVEFRDVYLWDANGNDYAKQRTGFVMTTGSLPPYFQFSTENEANVTVVLTELDSIYDGEYHGLDVDDYSSELIELSSLAIYDQLK